MALSRQNYYNTKIVADFLAVNIRNVYLIVRLNEQQKSFNNGFIVVNRVSVLYLKVVERLSRLETKAETIIARVASAMRKLATQVGTSKRIDRLILVSVR